MSDERRAVLEAIAYGNDPAIRPAERLQALELLDRIAPDDQWAIFREELAGLTSAELQLRLDAHVAAMFATADDDERSRAWPATMAALEAAVQRRVNECVAARPAAPVLVLARNPGEELT
jgi:hypothetical protein